MIDRILALDTSTEACSVAVGDRRVVANRWERLPRGHAARLLPMIEEVLAEAGWERASLGAIAFARGPGSFTGVRISAGAAQGLALGLGCPVIPVSTLMALAAPVLAQSTGAGVLAAIDARMGEVYWGLYERDAQGRPRSVGPERVDAPSVVTLPDGVGCWSAVGTGLGAHPQALEQRLGERLDHVDGARLPDAVDLWGVARALADNGKLLSPEAAVPVYLRDRVAG